MRYAKRLELAALFLVVTVASASAQTVTPSVVHGGQILSDIVAWGSTAFGATLATVITAGVYKFLQWMGIQVTDGQKAQLQAITVNGINAAAAKAGVSLSADKSLDVNVRNQVIMDAVAYTQDHAADTIKALGLDPKSGQAVEAIKARIATAIADPSAPTPPALGTTR